MKRLRFSTRSLLVIATIVAIAMAIHRQRTPIHQAVAALAARGAKVTFPSDSYQWFHRATWNYFANPVAVDMTGLRGGDEDAAQIAVLTSLENVYVTRSQLSVDGVGLICSLPELKRLSLWGSYGVHSDAIDELVKCKNLEALDIHETRIDGGDLERLDQLPNLRRLVFQAPSISNGSGWMSKRAIATVARIETASPVGKCYLRALGDEDMQRFLSLDTSRMVEMQLRHCKFSDQVWRQLGTLKLRELDVQFTPFGDAQLRMLRGDRIDELQIHYGPQWSGERVTIPAVVEFLQGKIDEITLIKQFLVIKDADQTDGCRLQMDVLAHSPRKPDFDLLTEAGLSRVTLMLGESRTEKLRILAEINPPIELDLHGTPQHWDLIKQMTRLKSLRIYAPSIDKPIRFSPQHQLESLTISGRFTVGQPELLEIAKLRRLRRIELTNSNPLDGRLSVLDQLPDLKSIQVYRQNVPSLSLPNDSQVD